MKLKFLVLAVVVGMFMRTFQARERFQYAHDNDLSSWIVKDMIVDHHFRLIGQLTSAPGIFIGPFFYYALVPFYVLSRMNPLAVLGFSWMIGLASIVSAFYIFTKLFNFKSGVATSLVYAASFNLSMTEREVVPTTPAFLWTLWFFYAINRLNQGKKSSLLLLAFLFSLVWSINLALGLLAPVVLIVYVLRLRSFKLSDLLLPAILFLVLSLPLILFEARHNFQQTRSLLSQGAPTHIIFLPKFMHVLQYASRNANVMIWDRPPLAPEYIVPLVLLVLFAWLFYRRVFSRFHLFLFLFWFALVTIFFTYNRINLSEYYLNSLDIITLSVLGVFLGHINKYLAYSLLTLFIGHNIYRLVKSPINYSGYIERTAAVNYIKADAAAHSYPCIAISYMTDPGDNFGYRFLFWRANMHVNDPVSNSPVYTIVFPHPRANHLDATFGALGIVLPDYKRYNPQGVAASCAGPNANVTDSMFGFTN